MVTRMKAKKKNRLRRPTKPTAFFRLEEKDRTRHDIWKGICARRGIPMVQRFLQMMDEDIQNFGS